jgi:monoamine oxidase
VINNTDSLKKKYDVVIIGSELEGMYLARAATDEGLHVLVLDPRENYGGQLLQGEMFFLDEPHDHNGKSLLQGEVKKLFDQFKSGKLRRLSEFTDYYNGLTKGVKILNGVQIEALNTSYYDNRKQIESLVFKDMQGKTNTVEASYWVENTDFNALTSKLDVTRIPGIETIYHEPQIDYMAAQQL